ncbi:MAG: hypothetical protein K9I92_05575 [Chitinophagaceae bacterium]|nr:hypothetical protein [Chitinophagaceae bacterium]
MIGIFKHNNPLALLLLGLPALLPVITPDTMVNAAVPAGTTAIFKALSAYLSFLDRSNGMFGKISYTALLLAEALIFNKIITDHKLMERAGLIPAMSFLLLNALLPFHTTLIFLVLNGMVLLVFKLFITMYKESNANNKMLLTGFIVGCMASMNTGFLILFCWAAIGIMIMRPASIREWLLATTGFILPFYFIFSGMYLLDKLNVSMVFPAASMDFTLPSLSPLAWTKTSLFLLLPWIGMFSYNIQIGKMMIQARKAYLIMLILIMATLVICLFSIKDISTILTLMLVPSALLFSLLFLAFKKNFIPNLIFLTLIILSMLR